MTTRLEQWHLVPDRKGGHRVHGAVHGHPTRRDGEDVLTSAIRGALGRVVVTASGSTYRLGEPLEAWVEVLAREGTPLDPEEPVKRFLPKGEP